MKKLPIYLFVLLISSITLLSSFTNKLEVLNPPNESEILLNYFESNSNFINSSDALIIPASEVKKNMKNEKYHLIDIRSASWFDYGHIKSATNVQPTDLLNHFKSTINPSDYDKIVLICYSGQSAAYFTSLLRMAGYDNTFSMNWGMSSWRADFAEKSWLKNIKDDNAGKLETTSNSKAAKGTLPSLSTGKTDAKEILDARLELAFATPYKEHIIKSADVFTNPADYYVVNYWSEDKYNSGHIPGAVQYTPAASISSQGDILTLPTDKKIAIYDSTGQKTAYVVAYLSILGYDVGNIAYGANSFMNKELKNKDWDGFSKKQVNMYPVVE